MDWLGTLLISGALVLLNLGLGTSVELGGPASGLEGNPLPPYAFPLLLGAALLFGVFVYWQRRAPEPLVPLSLFKRPNITNASLANFLTGFGLFVAIASVPLFVNTVAVGTLEQAAWDSGWLLSGLTIPMALASIPGGIIASRKGYRFPSVIGLVMAIAGFLLMTTWRVETTYFTMIWQLLLAGIGFGLLLAPIAAAVVDAAPETHRGTAAALVIIFRLMGMTVGVSSITTYGVFRANLLNAARVTAETTFVEMVQIGMQVAVQVINETFWIAGGVCLLAFVFVWRLRADDI